jgi:hypothetical protein
MLNVLSQREWQSGPAGGAPGEPGSHQPAVAPGSSSPAALRNGTVGTAVLCAVRLSLRHGPSCVSARGVAGGWRRGEAQPSVGIAGVDAWLAPRGD